MSRIDKDIALAMFRAAETDSNIASRFGTSRQAVNLLRKAMIKDGRLQALSHGGAAQSAATPPDNPTLPQKGTDAPAANTPQCIPPPGGYPTFDRMSDWVIHVIQEAGEAARLRQENAVLQQRADGLLAEVLTLRNFARQAREQLGSVAAKSSQYQTAIQQSNLPPPEIG